MTYAAWLIVIAVVFDFLDGFAARLLKATSPIGKDLDSLADMVTFGVLPSFIMYELINLRVHDQASTVIAYSAFSIALFSALRLARFNNDPRQSDSFIGLPTPANALLIASLPLISVYYPETAASLFSTGLLVALSLVMSCLLVAEIPLFALKFKSFGWRENSMRYVFLIVSALLAAGLQILAIPVIILFYVMLSMILRFISDR